MTVFRASDVGINYLVKQIAVLHEMADLVRQDAYDAIHKARVATRRSRSTLRVWRPVLRSDVVGDLRTHLAWYGEQLGRPRDTEVLSEHMADLLDETGAEERIRRRILDELRMLHDAAHGLLVAAMSSSRYELLMLRLSDLAADPIGIRDDESERSLPMLVGAAARRVSRLRNRAHAAAGGEGDHWWHETRKAAKAVRYALEAIRDYHGSDFDPLVGQWKLVTEELGLFQDAVIVRELLEPMATLSVRVGESPAPYQALLAAQESLSAKALAAGQTAVDSALEDISSLESLLG